MANSVDTDQTAPIGAVCSWSTLFASILNSSVMIGIFLLQTTFSDAIFFGALKVKLYNFLLDSNFLHKYLVSYLTTRQVSVNGHLS